MSLLRVVTYILRDCPEFGLMPGFLIMGLRLPNPAEAGSKPDHILKVWPQFYIALENGDKTFELRKDDREPKYAVGQILRLDYFDPATPAKPCEECGGRGVIEVGGWGAEQAGPCPKCAGKEGA